MPSFDIDATEHWVNTGIMLKANKRYQLIASGQWKDASIDTGPDGYESANLAQRATEKLRRMPSARWFALIGALEAPRKQSSSSVPS